MEGVMGAQAMSQDASVNPGIFPLLLFGYSLAVLGVELLITPEAAGALAFAIFVAAVGETIGGLWLSRFELIRIPSEQGAEGDKNRRCESARAN
jgi:hypothetical protein